uniref:RecQ-mediated genome instability protein 2 n=2 Tax=Strigops habroptila TaxID=2489341 RepID=A0A672TWS0_STRHB
GEPWRSRGLVGTRQTPCGRPPLTAVWTERSAPAPSTLFPIQAFYLFLTQRRWLHEAAFPVLEEGCSCSLCPHRQLVYRSRAAGSSGPGAPSRSRRRSSKRHPLCGGETRGAAQPPRTGKRDATPDLYFEVPGAGLPLAAGGQAPLWLPSGAGAGPAKPASAVTAPTPSAAGAGRAPLPAFPVSSVSGCGHGVPWAAASRRHSMAGGAPGPPVKVLAAQLRGAVRGAGGTWQLVRAEAGRAPLCLRAVWMQGTVLEVERGGPRGGSARLQDGSGPFTVLGVEEVPKGRPCLSPGKYVMVMGIVRSCSPEPVLRAIKMTDLSENPVHKDMWSLEVEDLHRVIP